MRIDAKIISKNEIKYKLIDLDENYSRDDRKIQTFIYELVKSEEEEEYQLIYQEEETSTMPRDYKYGLKAKVQSSDEMIITSTNGAFEYGKKYKIECIVYYSYMSLTANKDLFSYSQTNASKLEARFNKKFPGGSLSQSATTFTPFEVGNILSNGVEISSLSEQLKNALPDYKAQIREVANEPPPILQQKLVEIGYLGTDDKLPHAFFSYYPFITSSEVLMGEDVINAWDPIKLMSEFPLYSRAEVTLRSKRNSDVSDDKITHTTEDKITHTPVDQTIPNYTITTNKTPTISYSADWLLPSTNVIVNPSASTQYKALFPPILEAYQPAFVGQETSEYEIFFRLSDYTNFDEVAHVDFRITLQSNNTSIVNSSVWPDQIIYKIKNKNGAPTDIKSHGDGLYSVKIKTDVLGSGERFDLKNGHWEANTYYKVQARLGTSWSGWETPQDYVTWRNAQASQGRFSDWSTIMILKSIPRPETKIINNEKLEGQLQSEDIVSEVSSSPLFYGRYDQKNPGGLELLDTYEFILYSDNPEEGTQSSGVLQYNNSEADNSSSVTVAYRFQKELKDNIKYKVVFNTTTVNGYKDSDTYEFESFKLEDGGYAVFTEIEEEEGIIAVYLGFNSENPYSPGNYLITRTLTDKNNWEELEISQLRSGDKIYNSQYPEGLYFEPITKTRIENEKSVEYSCYKVYEDFTSESGRFYTYGVQRVRNNDYREQRAKSEPVCVNFEHIFLYADGQQLKLKYNPEISNFKHTVLASKQDTLGNKFPYISRNGYVYYAEFPFKALISFNSDENGKFLPTENSGKLITGQLKRVIEDEGAKIVYMPPEGDKKEEYLEQQKQLQKQQQISSTNLTYNNIDKERYFREEVEKFLNNGKYKLFRSSTEGNFIVNLMNINFTPEKQLGRMIYSVSGNAYEMADYNIKNLKYYNILQPNIYNRVIDSDIVLGQISGVFPSNINLIDEIAQDVIKYKDETIKEFLELNEIIIQPFPKVSLAAQRILQTAALEELEQTKDFSYTNGMLSLDSEGKLQYYCDNKDNKWNKLSLTDEELTLDEIETIEDNIAKSNAYLPMEFMLNSNKIIILPDTPYVLTNQKFTLSDSMYFNKIRNAHGVETSDFYQPILLDYVAKIQIKESDQGVIESSYARKRHEQLAGYFYETGSAPYIPFESLIYTNEITNNNYYNSLDIIELIKEKIRLDIIEERNLNKDIYWENNKLSLDNLNEVILYKINNVIIETQKPNIKVNGKSIEDNAAGLIVQTIDFSEEGDKVLSFDNDTSKEYMVPAKVTYDYEIQFITYKEKPQPATEDSNKEGENNNE